MGGANNTWARTGRGERAPSETVSSWPFRACRSAARNGNSRTVRDLPVASLDDRVDFALTPEFFPSRIFPIRRPAAREEPARGGDGDELREETGSSVQEAFALVRHAHRRQVALDRPHAGPAHRGRRLVAAPGARRFARGRSDAARAPAADRRGRDACLSRLPARRRARRSRRRTRARRPPRGRRLLAVRFPADAGRAERGIRLARGPSAAMRRRAFRKPRGCFHQTLLKSFPSLRADRPPPRFRTRAYGKRERRGTRRLRSSRAGEKRRAPARRRRRGGLRPRRCSANPFAAAAKAAARASAHRAEPLAGPAGTRVKALRGSAPRTSRRACARAKVRAPPSRVPNWSTWATRVIWRPPRSCCAASTRSPGTSTGRRPV